MKECNGCGNPEPEYIKLCPRCENEKCNMCDMGDDVECGSCGVDMNLESVQTGDTLIYNDRNPADSKIVEVERTTKTQIIAGGQRFLKSSGRLVGTTVWDSVNVTIPKDGEIEKVQNARLHQRLVYKISGACQVNQLRKLTLDQLEELNALRGSYDSP